MGNLSNFELNFDKKDLKLLRKHAMGSKFILETGSGISTKFLAKAARLSKATICTIDMADVSKNKVNGVNYLIGWSITCDDIIKVGDPGYIEHKKYRGEDWKIANSLKHEIEAPNDLIRHAIMKVGKCPDFVFLDSGEYCGLAEWNIVKDLIPSGGKIALHDIYYPKSIKHFQTVAQIEQDASWETIVKTKSRQGMFIGVKK